MITDYFPNPSLLPTVPIQRKICYNFRNLICQQHGSDRSTDHETKVKLFNFETNFKVTGYLTFTEFTETLNYLWNLPLNNISNYLILVLDLQFDCA